MNVLARIISAAALTLFVGGAARAASTILPAPSTWELNAAKCDFGGVPGMKSDVWKIQVDTDKRFKYTDVMTLDSGQVVNNSWDGPPDDSLHASPGWPGTKIGYNLAAGTAQGTMDDGSSMDGKMSLSGDGKTLTIKMDMRAKDGSVAHQTLVYQRTK